MAKPVPSKSGISRIRFIMLDAEIPEGDLSQITAAIQNALKPTTTIIQQRLPAVPPNSLGERGADDAVDGEFAEMPPVEDAEPAPSAPREPRVARKPIAPKVLDLDLTSGVSFEDFAHDHPPKTDVDRYLVVLAWFKDQRPDEAVTASHIYTCYRVMKWPSGIDDFGKALRYLKSQQLVKSTGRGQYEINHLGTAKVDDLRTVG